MLWALWQSDGPAWEQLQKLEEGALSVFAGEYRG